MELRRPGAVTGGAGDAVPKAGCKDEHSHLKTSELTSGAKFTRVPGKLAVLCCGFLRTRQAHWGAACGDGERGDSTLMSF